MKPHLWILLAGVGAVVTASHSGIAADPGTPTPTLNLPCEITEVYDGDTLTVQVKINVRVRLLDCWAHEVRTKDLKAKAKGIASRDHLRGLVPTGAKGLLVIPLGGATRLDDIFTMGRVLANVHVADKSLSDEQVKAGHAWKTKEELEAARDN